MPLGSTWIDITTNASDVGLLEGLHFLGGDIELNSGGSLYIRNCVIRNSFRASAPSPGFGIRIAPNGLAKVVISGTAVD
jgi:hypothetical protein